MGEWKIHYRTRVFVSPTKPEKFILDFEEYQQKINFFLFVIVTVNFISNSGETCIRLGRRVFEYFTSAGGGKNYIKKLIIWMRIVTISINLYIYIYTYNRF